MVKLIKIPVHTEKEYGRAEKDYDYTLKTWVTKYKTSRTQNEKYTRLKKEYTDLVINYRESQAEEFVGGMPVQMEKDCISQLLRTDHDGNLVYGITLKVDGERYLLFLSSDHNIYFIDRALMFYYFVDDLDNELLHSSERPMLLDGEMINNESKYEFLVFDLLIYNSESWIDQPYYKRYDVANYVINNLKIDLAISLKPWFLLSELLKTNNIYSHVFKKTNESRKIKLKADGLILQPLDTKYVTFGPWSKYNNVLFKWKPPEDLTIDFKIKIVKSDEWELLTKSGMNYDIPQGDKDPVHAITVPTEANKKNYRDGDVAEFKIVESAFKNPLGNKFKIVRPRPEKDANGLYTIMSTMNVIHNPFYLDIITPSVKLILSGKKSELQMYSRNNLILCILNTSLFFTKYEIDLIESIYTLYLNTPNAELEFRLLKNSKNLDKGTFYYLFDFFNNSFINQRTVTTDITTARDTSNKVFRSTYSFDNKLLSSEYKLKIKDFTLKNDNKMYNNLNLKLQLSQEVPVNVVTKDGTIRIKDRYSYTLGLWKIDITKVLTKNSITDSGKESFELECEFINRDTQVSFEEFIKSFSDLYILILKNSSYC